MLYFWVFIVIIQLLHRRSLKCGLIYLLIIDINGLNIPEKRNNVIREMNKQKVSILMLQETHLKG